MKKASFKMSTEAIIIVVLAIFFLILAIIFITDIDTVIFEKAISLLGLI